MAARRPSWEQRILCQFPAALSSAFSEWLLILLLLIDAFCVYLVKKLYHSCKLQTPCLLCSRISYLLGNEKVEFFRDFVCDVHKMEIASLAFCHVHKKLGDAWEMCETCLLSFTKKRSSLETCKFLLSKLSMDLDDSNQMFNTTSDDMVKVPLLNKDREAGSQGTPCSCCSQPCNIKPCAFGLYQNKPIFKELACPDSPLSARLRARVHLPGRLSKAREIPSTSLINSPSRIHDPDRLLHFGYRELKFTSESESEVPLSDDDDGNTNIRGSEHAKEELFSQRLKPSSSIPIAPKNLYEVSDDIVPEKLILPDPILSDASAFVSKSQLHKGNSCDKSFARSTSSLGHGLEEINWSHVEAKPNPPISSKITSEPVPTEIPDGEEFSQVVDALRSSTSDVEVTKNLNLTDISSNGDKVMRGSDQNLTSGVKGTQLQPTPSEIILARESARLHENLKLRMSQLPTAFCLESPRFGINPSAVRDDEYKLSDTSSSSGMQNVTKRLDSVLSYLESADECVVTEFEGEAAVDRLKRHIEMDHKSLSVLYKELEEERNASAIAANQAMAMINKLQEEKAAMQLEVMQYLRMMEEQTEYEQEALQKLNDQLMEREKEIQDLETELENYRKRSGSESLAGKVLLPSYESDESEYSTTSTPHLSKTRGRDKHHMTSIMFHDSAWPASSPIRENVLDFEDEREYISECLNRLEKNVRLFSSAVASRHDEVDDEFDDEIVAEHMNENGRTRHDFSHNTNGESYVTREINQMEEKISSVENRSTTIRSQPFEENSISPTQEPESTIQETENDIRLKSSSCYNKLSKAGKRNDVIALGDEVEHLNARLEALEADRDFLEYTINSLKNGKDGVEFVQEIAAHLRELRKIGLIQRERIFP